VRWGSFSVYGVKLHLICATNGIPLSYELTPANVADISLAKELITEAALGDGVARTLLGDLAYWDSPARADTFTLGDAHLSYSILLEVGGAPVAKR
jgi:hypothetical protein